MVECAGVSRESWIGCHGVGVGGWGLCVMYISCEGAVFISSTGGVHFWFGFSVPP